VLTPQFDQLLRSAEGEFETAEGDTVWRLKLPARAMAESASPREAAALKSVMVLEDDPSILKVLLRILEREGFSVTPSTSNAEALAVIEGANFDLLIADAKLPDGDSSAVIRRFRERNASGRNLVCSGFIEGDGVLAEVESLGVAFLQKPFGQQRLLATLGALQAPRVS
jgi:DNA-binding response OmpR family regulator